MSVVSQDYKYSPEPEGLASRCYRTILPSENGTYGLGQRVLINIPHTHNGFINTSNSWLNVTMDLKGLTGAGITGNVCLSNIGIYSCIDQINIVSGSTGLVQEIRNHQEIMALLLNNNSDRSAQLPNSICAGTTAAQKSNIRQNTAFDVTGGAIATQTYSIPLIGLMGAIKHLPVGFINQGLQIELLLTNSVTNIIFSKVGSATAVIGGGETSEFSFEYDADVVVVNDNSMRLIKEASSMGNSGIMSWSDTQIHCTTNTVTTAELNNTSTSFKQTLIGGVKPKSLLSVFHTGFGGSQKSGDPWNLYAYWSKDFRLRLGSQEYPPRFIETMAEAQSHLQDCLGQNAVTLYSSLADHTSSDLGARQPAATAATSSTTTGACGYNFENFVDTAQGIDTTGKQLLTDVSLVVSPSGATTNTIRAATYKRFAVIYSIAENGDFSVSY